MSGYQSVVRTTTLRLLGFMYNGVIVGLHSGIFGIQKCGLF